MKEHHKHRLAVLIKDPATKECVEAVLADLRTKAVAERVEGLDPKQLKAYRKEHLHMLWAFQKLIRKMGANAKPETETKE